MLFQKIRMAIAGKKTVAASIVLAIVAIAGIWGINIDPELQKELTVCIASLIAIFMKLGDLRLEKMVKEAASAARRAEEAARKAANKRK